VFLRVERQSLCIIDFLPLGFRMTCPNRRNAFPEYRAEPTEDTVILLLEILLFMEGAI